MWAVNSPKPEQLFRIMAFCLMSLKGCFRNHSLTVEVPVGFYGEEKATLKTTCSLQRVERA